MEILMAKVRVPCFSFTLGADGISKEEYFGSQVLFPKIF